MAEQMLMSGEEIKFETKKHWFAPLADSMWAILMIIGALVLSWLEPDASDGVMGFIGRVIELIKLGLFLGGLGWIVYNIVAWRTAIYKVTNLRVLMHEGLVRSREADTLLTSISDVRSKIPFLGKIFGFGSIEIFTASGSAGADEYTTVRDVESLKRAILEEKMSGSGGPELTRALSAAVAGSTPAAAAQAQPDAMATLEQLGKLRDSGVITAEEFEAKKQELLSRI